MRKALQSGVFRAKGRVIEARNEISIVDIGSFVGGPDLGRPQ